MTITIPGELENDVTKRAARLQIPVEDLVQRALHWYMAIDAELVEEIAAWEATGLDDLARFEESLP